MMTFLLTVLAIRYLFYWLDRLARRKETDIEGWEDGPSEQNVWW